MEQWCGCPVCHPGPILAMPPQWKKWCHLLPRFTPFSIFFPILKFSLNDLQNKDLSLYTLQYALCTAGLL